MGCTFFHLLGLIPVYFWKDPSKTVHNLNEKARRLGPPHTTASFLLRPGCRGREPPPRLQLKRHRRSNRFELGLAESRGSFYLLAICKEEL